MTNTVLIKRSGTASAVPLAANLALGELAINYTDGNLFYKNNSGTVTVIASNQFLSVTGNVTGGNILTGGLISASGNILTGGLISATGNIVSAGNIIASKVVTANDYIAINSTSSEGGQLVLSWAGINNLTNQANSTWNLDTDAANTFRVFYQNGVGATAVLLQANSTSNLVSFPQSAGVSATGNITGGNVLTVGLISATGTVTGSSHLGAVVSVTANITGGNILTGGLVSSTGNIITAGNISAVGTIYSNGVTNTTAFAVGNSAVSNVALGMFPTAGTPGEYAIRDYSNVYSSMYFDVGMGGTANGAFIFRTSNSFRQLANINSLGINTPLAVSATGNVTGNYFIGNGSQLTGIVASASSSIVNGTSNVVVAASGNVTVGVAGSAAVATFTTSGLTANIVAATNNGNGTNFKVGDDAWIGDVNTADTMSIRGQQNAANGYIVFGNADSTSQLGRAGSGPLTYNGAFSAVGNITGGNLLTAGLISSTGTITGSSLLGAVVSVTANVTGGNITTGGLVTATGNITGGNLLTAGLVSATSSITSAANVNANNVIATTIVNAPSYTGTIVSVTGNVTGGNILTGGLISATSTITSAANVAGLNITTSGNMVATGNVSGGNVAASTLVYSFGTIQGVGNVTGGNILTAGLITATGNITGGNLITSGSGGTISGTGNIIAGNILTAGLVSATANITGGNILTAGLVSATGNVTGNYILGNGALLTGVITSVANINNGTSNVTVVSSGGNVTVGIGGTSNVAVFATTGEYVTGLISASGNIISAANVAGGNILTGGLISATGTVTGSSLLGTVASLSGNVTGSNVLTAGQVSATGNVIGGNVNTGALRPLSGALTISTVSGNLNLQPTSGNIVVNSTYINGVTNPVQDQDVATKSYVDNLVSTQISYHSPVVAATIANLATTTGGTITYTQPNGAGNGVGALLTTTGSFNLIDTANVQTLGTRILVKNEGNSVFNGIYTWANATNIVRSTDTDEYGPDSANALSLNDYFFVSSGNVNAGSAWVVNAPSGTITFGTSNITFAQFSSSQTYTANTSAGISINGTVISAKVDNTTTAFDGSGNISVKASANLTTPNIGAATGTSLSVTGNITGGNLLTGGLISATGTITSAANITGGNVLTGGLVSATGNVTGNYILGNGALLTGVITSVANINNGTSNVTVVSSGGNVTVGVGGTGNVAVFATTGEYVTGLISASGNVTGGNLLTAGIISATGNIRGGNVSASSYYYANGVAIINYTAATTPPASPSTGWQWYNTSTDVLYEYITDGTTPYWVDVSSPAFSNGPAGNMSLGGSLLPNANITYDLGSSTNRWKDLWLAGTTLYLGDAVLSASGTSVSLGTGNVTGGNITTAGIVSATGNVSGNYFIGNGSALTGIDATSIQNSTSNVRVVSAGGNVAIGIGGTANVAVFATTGEYITGVLSASGNVTGGNILTGGIISATGNITGGNLNVALGNISGNLIVSGTIQDAGQLDIATTASNGNIVLTPNGTGNVNISSNIMPTSSNATANIGSATAYFNTMFGKATTAQYADLAENYLGDAEYAPGTVLDFDGEQEVTLSIRDSSKRVAGVVSTNPAHLMNSTLNGAHVTAVALTGRVPTLVTGKIAKGDLMVSAGNGRARSESNPSVGTVIGKSLENFNGGEGTIEIVISMQ